MAKTVGRADKMQAPEKAAAAPPKPQSPVLVWTVLNHVLLLPLAGAFLPMGLFRAGIQDGQGMVAAAVLAVLVVLTHGVCWRVAARAGERGLAGANIVLGLLSLAALALLSTPSPLVAAVQIGKLFI
ncbi:hypothetical protein [Stappia sp. WLB 29]|uniref:hypothetical protein n=1 Tax=Stappia sp. WLB 29 TaxID=2925220 RepID=UPI0020BFF760|nr:hypothetical protein [Stappia sp. WLB 29]